MREWLCCQQTLTICRSEQIGLYCSEIRGVIKTTGDSVAVLNIGHCNCVHGLFVRRDVLNDYLKCNGYVMFYYMLGEKVFGIGQMNSIIKDLSASHQYQLENEVVVIQSGLPKEGR